MPVDIYPQLAPGQFQIKVYCIVANDDYYFSRKTESFETGGMTLLKRFTLIIDDGTVEHVFYPVSPPDRSASDVIDWLSQGTRSRAGISN